MNPEIQSGGGGVPVSSVAPQSGTNETAPISAQEAQERAALLANADEAGRQRLERIYAARDYVPNPDATEYDGPRDEDGEPLALGKWKRSRKERLPKRPLGTWSPGNGREVMDAVMEFANRNEADYALINKKGVKMPHALHAYLGEITGVVDDIAFNGGFGREWGSTRKDVDAQRAAVRILARVVMELGELLGMKPEMNDEPAPDINKFVAECVAEMRSGKTLKGLDVAMAHLIGVAFPKKEGSVYAGNPFDGYQGGANDMRATLAHIRLGRLSFEVLETAGETYMEEKGLKLERE